jgi:cephalosporin hydroxylase
VTATKFSLKKEKQEIEGYHIIRIANEIRKNKYRLTESQLEAYTLSYLGSKVPKEFQLVHDFENYQEALPKYTPESLNLVAVLDNFILDIINKQK